MRGHWELSEPEEKGDGDVLLEKDSCHASSLCGNAFMPEQVSLGKQVNLFKRCFVITHLVLFLSNKIENVLGEKC